MGGILEKKLSQPRFKEALAFGAIKRAAEEFFREKKLAVDILEFDFRSHTLVLKTPHSSMSRELLSYHEELNEFFATKNSPKINHMRVMTKFSH